MPLLRTQLVSAAVVATLLTLVLSGARPSTAVALNLNPVCGAAGWISGVVGKTCNALQHGDKLLSAGKKLVTGHIGGAAKTLAGGGSSSSGLGFRAGALVGLAVVGSWVLGGARAALKDTAKVLDKTTRPQLQSTWFSTTYWRMAGIASLLTLPFLFAAAIQALLRSDLSLLLRSAFGYLPLSLLTVSVAAPLTMLLLAASDQVSGAVSAAAGGAGTRFLAQEGIDSVGLSVLSRSPFVAFFVGLLTVAVALLLWIEMLAREAAVYVVVLMLPLAFAAMVWPARRVWAVRVVEVLVALILSKFAVVSVLALGGAALGQTGGGGEAGMLVGLVLVLIAALSPWALVRLLPMTEMAAAAGQLHGDWGRMRTIHGAVETGVSGSGEWARSVTSGMRREAEATAEPAVEPGSARGEVEKVGAVADDGAVAADVAIAGDGAITGDGTLADAGGAPGRGGAPGNGGDPGGVGGDGGGVGGDGAIAAGAPEGNDAATPSPVSPVPAAAPGDPREREPILRLGIEAESGRFEREQRRSQSPDSPPGESEHAEDNDLRPSPPDSQDRTL